MPRFFFNIHDQYGAVPDREGCELAGLSNALDEATLSARELCKQYIDSQRTFSQSCIDIVDAQGVVLAALFVREIIEHPAHPKFDVNRVRAANLARVEGALEDAEREHLTRKLAFEKERGALDTREAAEDRRWLVEEAELMAAVEFSHKPDR